MTDRIHELNIKPEWLERVKAGQKRAEVRKHDRDFQAGDLLHLFELDRWGRRVQVFVERDAKGRFVNEYVDKAPVVARILHVLDGRHADGLDDDYCVLSIEVLAGEST